MASDGFCNAMLGDEVAIEQIAAMTQPICVSKSPFASAPSAFASATYDARQLANFFKTDDLQSRHRAKSALLTMLTQIPGTLNSV
jgi:hypothetical protein